MASTLYSTTIDLAGTGRTNVKFEFDRQARPHIVLVCPQMTGAALGLKKKKPSYWDLPASVQAQLLGMQLSFGRTHSIPQIRIEVHLGSWASNHWIHSHIVLPLTDYFDLRARATGAPASRDDVARRAKYIEKVKRDHHKFHALDKPNVEMAVLGGAPKTQYETSAFEKVVFDPEESGTSTIDLSFTHSLGEMPLEALTVAVKHINDLCGSLGLSAARGGAFLLVPAPGAATAHTARLVVPPEDFALCLPEPARKPWFEKWMRGDPVARAVRECLDPLPPVAHAA